MLLWFQYIKPAWVFVYRVKLISKQNLMEARAQERRLNALKLANVVATNALWTWHFATHVVLFQGQRSRSVRYPNAMAEFTTVNC